MKTVYVIGVLVFLLITVSSASAASFYLTEVNDHTYDGKIRIEVSYSGSTITVKDVSTSLDGISNVDIKEIGIQLPTGYRVTSVVDSSKPANRWSASSGNYQESEFGRFNTQIIRDPGKSSKTRGPITINLNKELEGTLPLNNNQNSVVVHISFGEKKEALVGSTWVGGSAQIPEFPSIALPVAAIMGLMFILDTRRKE
ncbi:hypothetical protein EO98_15120 [Methanosarcina sp. 2.H.T.1A.6]|uniref:PEF-CTERM sorting domain-containing protein n=1 Tax=unclassified Methanosarcina TaxID=2644672 RepID=UPI0006226CE1|nr:MULTISPECIES: PEF-CTERM sorting domain-containing protein [unclassified Methanosarcina]KKG15884.1 hypothetical protein EO97_14260 [Methanosarcina sp. 2.H.T.1A.15]KKG16704.1 hypothetical protein EO94_00530 [Methanosarcina sp. 2.H.T.1A.3]KKG22837.1 hypothetical protein EO98_15120 [Methanosarcina sp. 2.H.T.1A.6]KKG24433.1 hypothetical protein EO96_14745 [Methanosarcina sp. 2.H.T.1A.8]